jgi:L-cysteine desulfidase
VVSEDFFNRRTSLTQFAGNSNQTGALAVAPEVHPLDIAGRRVAYPLRCAGGHAGFFARGVTMDILKDIFAHEVFPAFGCTEPIAVAYAAAVAARELGEPVRNIRITVDPGVYKNGKSVVVPNTGGERGNVIAGVIGAFLAKPELKMEILKAADPGMVAQAKGFIADENVTIDYDDTKQDLFIDVVVHGAGHSARVVVAGGHTNVVRLERDGQPVMDVKTVPGGKTEPEYRSKVRNMTIEDLVRLAENAGPEDLEYVRKGIDMNLAMIDEGLGLRKVGYQLGEMMKATGSHNDVVAQSKVLTAAVSDGRMAGLPFPVMSSGGAGNQGVVAILVAHFVGEAWGMDKTRILRSITLSHLINSYVKCFTGDLSAICGCAIAAGMGAAVALVYQRCGPDVHKMGLAINTIVSDLGGIFCDGAKEGCAVKVAGSTDAAIRAAYMAINGFGVSAREGITGDTPEKTIQNLARTGGRGMSDINRVILEIMRENDQSKGCAAPART